MIYSIPVSEGHFRSIKDPNNENIHIAHALVNVNDLPFDLPLDPDPVHQRRRERSHSKSSDR
jgi:hypothetical protein